MPVVVGFCGLTTRLCPDFKILSGDVVIPPLPSTRTAISADKALRSRWSQEEAVEDTDRIHLALPAIPDFLRL